MLRISIYLCWLVLAVSIVACNGKGPDRDPVPDTVVTTPPPKPTLLWGYSVVQSYPHDPLAFTQGLVFHGGSLYEGTGLHDSSSIRRVDLASGNVQRMEALPRQYFGEGIALHNGRFYQLTWQNNVCFVYDAMSFQRVDTFSYYGEGWGLTTDGENLIMSDGSSTLRIIDPATFKLKSTVTVFDGSTPVSLLNELEYIRGEVYANVWRTDRIVRIDPTNGKVLGWIDLAGILPDAERTGREDVLNGIAYDAAGDRLFVTGKHWAKLYQIRLTGEGSENAPGSGKKQAADTSARPKLK